jgi:hypothetical protein
MTLRSMYKFRIIRTILWGIPAVILNTAASRYNTEIKRRVYKISLSENGTEAVFSFQNCKDRIIAIKNIK